MVCCPPDEPNFPVFHNDVPVGVQGIARDVTERKLLEEHLRQGTTFKIYLPLVREPAEDYKHAAPAVHLPKATETVLLVEDAEMARNLAKVVLETSGYRVLVD